MGQQQISINKDQLSEVVKQVIFEYEKQQQENSRRKRDRRLRNTKLLLRNYNNFQVHCKNAVYTSKQLDDLGASDILDEIENIDDEGLYVNSIKRTHDRTYIIVKHIKRALQFYRYSAERNNDENAIRGYKAIELLYIAKEKVSYEEISEKLHVSERTVFRDIRLAIEGLSSLLFGIDGVKLEK